MEQPSARMVRQAAEAPLLGHGIRHAVRADAPAIHAMIRALAVYEHLEAAMRCTVADLERWCFGDDAVAETLVAEEGGRVVGYALFFRSFSTFVGAPGIYLEDVYVEEACRGRGHGRRLLLSVAALARARGCGRVEWAVLDWNAPSIRFYRSLGATPLDEWTMYRLSGEALARLPPP